jgi:hypothetical protein
MEGKPQEEKGAEEPNDDLDDAQVHIAPSPPLRNSLQNRRLLAPQQYEAADLAACW